MKSRIASRFFFYLLTSFLLAVPAAPAQTIAYRRTILTSDIDDPGFAINLNPALKDPWGIAFVKGFPFYTANLISNRVFGLDDKGAPKGPGGFIVPSPIGIVADSDSIFANLDSIPASLIEIVTATRDGGVYFWNVDSEGIFPTVAKQMIDNSQSGAVYTGIAIMKQDCCVPFLVVANFHTGLIEAYRTDFTPLGTLRDPDLPDGYAPYGMQVIGNQLFVAYALQDVAKREPVFGAGNGIVSIFNLDGRFLRRFATAGPLNAPWGITQACADFGPFSNDILIGNVGDGVINAFDPVTGDLAGQIRDGDGNLIINGGLHALAFRSDGFADPDTLYFTDGILAEHGVFGTLTKGLVSTTTVTVPTSPANTPAPITVKVSAGPGNSGTPEGLVTVFDNGTQLAEVGLINGEIRFPAVLTGVGTHTIEAQYEGDNSFLPGTAQTHVEITGPITTLTLTAPSSAAIGSTVTLTATIHAEEGTPTGEIVFHDGNSNIGTVPLDAGGVATLLTSNLSNGVHLLSASYGGDGQFAGSTSAAASINIVSRDFSLGAAPLTATVAAGQSASFNLTVTPTGGFVDPVTFSCPQIAGITCAFNPPTVTPNAGVATTTLTVSTSASLRGSGLNFNMSGPGLVLASLGFLAFLAFLRKRTSRLHTPFLRLATRGFALITLAVALSSCGGNTASAPTAPGTTSLIEVTAHSTTVSRTTTISLIVH